MKASKLILSIALLVLVVLSGQGITWVTMSCCKTGNTVTSCCCCTTTAQRDEAAVSSGNNTAACGDNTVSCEGNISVCEDSATAEAPEEEDSNSAAATRTGCVNNQPPCTTIESRDYDWNVAPSQLLNPAPVELAVFSLFTDLVANPALNLHHPLLHQDTGPPHLTPRDYLTIINILLI